MSETTPEARFAAAARHELGMAGDAVPGASVVTVAAPDVNIAPRIVAELPALNMPVPISDVDAGAFGFHIRVTRRTDSGSIDEVAVTPEIFHPLEQFR